LGNGWVIPSVHGADEIDAVNALGFVFGGCVDVKCFVRGFDVRKW